jgi:hypothetical protein
MQPMYLLLLLSVVIQPSQVISLCFLPKVMAVHIPR